MCLGEDICPHSRAKVTGAPWLSMRTSSVPGFPPPFINSKRARYPAAATSHRTPDAQRKGASVARTL